MDFNDEDATTYYMDEIINVIGGMQQEEEEEEEEVQFTGKKRTATEANLFDYQQMGGCKIIPMEEEEEEELMQMEWVHAEPLDQIVDQEQGRLTGKKRTADEAGLINFHQNGGCKLMFMGEEEDEEEPEYVPMDVVTEEVEYEYLPMEVVLEEFLPELEDGEIYEDAETMAQAMEED
jgi:hypothetical protein